MQGLNKEEKLELSVRSGRTPKYHKRIVYVGLDRQEGWYLHAVQGWVRNVPMDLMTVSYD